MEVLDLSLFELSLIILIFAILQSIVGVGLLLFGTPTLLLLGYPYEVVLSIVLPSSITISVMQVIDDHEVIYGKKYLFLYALPSICLGLYYITYIDIDIVFIVGIMLLIIGFVRISSRLNDFLRLIVRNNEGLYCILMGIVHGTSNMGGGLLTVYMSTLNNDKTIIRSSIAYWYLIFALIQLMTLYLSDLLILSTEILLLMLVSLVSYLIVGRLLAIKISNNNYQILITLFIFIYGVSCIAFTG